MKMAYRKPISNTKNVKYQACSPNEKTDNLWGNISKGSTELKVSHPNLNRDIPFTIDI